MEDGIFQSLPFLIVSLIRRLYVDKHLLIEVDLAPTFINNIGRDHRVAAFVGRLGANIKLHHAMTMVICEGVFC